MKKYNSSYLVLPLNASFDVGYKFKSDSLSVNFLSLCRTTTCFWDSGSLYDCLPNIISFWHDTSMVITAPRYVNSSTSSNFSCPFLWSFVHCLTLFFFCIDLQTDFLAGFVKCVSQVLIWFWYRPNVIMQVTCEPIWMSKGQKTMHHTGLRRSWTFQFSEN